MDIIEEYAESQHDDEQWTLWIALISQVIQTAPLDGRRCGIYPLH